MTWSIDVLEGAGGVGHTETFKFYQSPPIPAYHSELTGRPPPLRRKLGACPANIARALLLSSAARYSSCSFFVFEIPTQSSCSSRNPPFSLLSNLTGPRPATPYPRTPP